MYQDKIYTYLQSDDYICDDCLSDILSIRPRQQVKQICNELQNSDKIIRKNHECRNCNKLKFVNIMDDDNKFRKRISVEDFNKYHHKIWSYSKYYGELFSTSYKLYTDKSGQGALHILFNLTEILIKSKLDSYIISFNDACMKLLDDGMICELEYEFLNNKSYGIRGVRNIMTHANLMKFNLIYPDDSSELMYPMTEDYNCLVLYENIAPKLSEILVKIICDDEMDQLACESMDILSFPNIVFKKLTIEQLIRSRGLNVESTLEAFKDMPLSKQYALIENLSPKTLKMSLLESLMDPIDADDGKIDFV